MVLSFNKPVSLNRSTTPHDSLRNNYCTFMIFTSAAVQYWSTRCFHGHFLWGLRNYFPLNVSRSSTLLLLLVCNNVTLFSCKKTKQTFFFIFTTWTPKCRRTDGRSTWISSQQDWMHLLTERRNVQYVLTWFPSHWRNKDEILSSFTARNTYKCFHVEKIVSPLFPCEKISLLESKTAKV